VQRGWILAAALTLAWSGAAADEIAPKTDGSLLDRLGSPADPAATREALAVLPPDDSGAALELAEALGRSGGQAAAEALGHLLRHRDDRVRAGALRAASYVGLRTSRLASGARSALVSRHVELRMAALETVGAIGDGRDMVHLLALAADAATDARSSKAAFVAMHRMSGLTIPHVAVRWEYAWRTVQARAAAELPRALDALVAGSPDAGVEALRETIVRYGWVDLPVVELALQTWLESSDYRLREEACRLAPRLRLADLAPAILQTHKYAPNRAVALRSAAQTALTAFGVR
jgi:hypothetical protein